MGHAEARGRSKQQASSIADAGEPGTSRVPTVDKPLGGMRKLLLRKPLPTGSEAAAASASGGAAAGAILYASIRRSRHASHALYEPGPGVFALALAGRSGKRRAEPKPY